MAQGSTFDREYLVTWKMEREWTQLVAGQVIQVDVLEGLCITFAEFPREDRSSRGEDTWVSLSDLSSFKAVKL